MKLQEFKDYVANEHLVRIEKLVREVLPGGDPKVTLLVRMPWLPDGGIIITNDSADEAKRELERVFTKEAIR